ncbi:probable carboxylesterase 15 [Ananas comosus]|uniref:Probable carboxylesterase 15 n=1 Tax=Ananas comosus TaxID=4615 RepID=A0A6P5FDZ3_ANACO|nr:probable carboxylesterase 15 [Ananas comosus]
MASPLATANPLSSPPPPPPHVVEDCRGAIRVLSDGTILRSPDPIFPVTVHDDGSVEWKDSLYDPQHDLHLRLYRPRRDRSSDHCSSEKLPLLFYFHGGGFCIGSRTWPNFHAWCLRLAAELNVFVISADYRLAPEHRLPAAVDDGATALSWLRSQAEAGAGADPWIAESVDFGRVFVSGDSAGGNITHHMAVRFGPAGLGPVRVRGFILLMPAFGGAQPTRSESECPPDAFLNREQSERYCRLMLPPGATKDYPVFNPFGPESPNLGPVETGPILMVVAERDVLRDREVDYVMKMRELGKHVELVEFAGQQHGFFEVDPYAEPVDELIRLIGRFMDQFGHDSA